MLLRHSCNHSDSQSPFALPICRR